MKTLLRFFANEEDNLSLSYLTWFAQSFNSKDFRGLDKLLFSYITYCSDLAVLTKRKYLEAFMRTDGKNVIRTNSIKPDTSDILDYSDPSALERGVRMLTEAIFTYYDDALSVPLGKDDSFKICMNTWLNEQRKNLLMNCFRDGYVDIDNGVFSEDIILDAQSELRRIQKEYDQKKLNKLDFISKVSEASEDNLTKSAGYIGKTGFPCVDGANGGIYKEDIITVTGNTGVGKTRSMLRAFYNLAVGQGISVRIESMELSKYQCENILIAMHIITLHKGNVMITDRSMREGSLSTEQLKYYNEAKLDLFSNPRYGKFYINEDRLYISTFYDDAISWLRRYRDCQVWGIDYVGYAGWSDNDLRQIDINKASIIEKFYDAARVIGKETGIAFWALNQYTKDGRSIASAGKVPDCGEIQGGQSVNRYSTFNVYITQTPEQEVVGQQCWSNDKGRFNAKKFTLVPFKTNLGISLFTQLNKEVKS